MADEQDDLGAFGQAEHEQDQEKTDKEQKHLMVFSFAEDMFGVQLKDVDSVIPWREPATVPQGNRSLAGVIQDHGRIIAVLSHPAGQDPGEGNAETSRIIVCNTQRGLIGLPASETHHVGPVGVQSHPGPGEVADTDRGVLTYLEAATLANSILTDGTRKTG
jgi:chemotaxis signal transduction protein